MIPETKLFGKVEVDRIVYDRHGNASIVACWGKHKHLIASIVLRSEKSDKWLVIEVDEKTYQDFLCSKINHDQVFKSQYQYGILIERFNQLRDLGLQGKSIQDGDIQEVIARCRKDKP